MNNYFEQIAKVIYREWKAANRFTGRNHPNEETLACFLEDKLSLPDKKLIHKHLLSCDSCAEYLSTQLKIQTHLSLDVPAALLEKIKKSVGQDTRENLLEIFIHLKEKALEIVQTTGDVLLGQELVPAPVLRSRKINEFKEEVSILKDLQQVRVMAKIQNKTTKSFNLTITVRDKQVLKADKNLRVALIKDGVELESYVNESGSSFFEDILPGNYLVEISRQGQREAVIDLKVKV
ncbi:MAG: hypothetical protein COV73_00200 [Candidatus Omnitrophica bacterium CG11_big_fil_rev_8_21_14_0_20_43_6]|nr:MAG: hypothetical protein COV73_00200 [Candidatus Omnitrophica bacterium CG11_big_fil_rev_8_21_14_0_20_43_6]